MTDYHHTADTKTFKDPETVLLTLNMSYHTKTKIADLKKHLISLKGEDGNITLADMKSCDVEGTLFPKETLFHFLFEGFLKWMVSLDYGYDDKESLEYYKKTEKIVKNFMEYAGENIEMLEALSWHEFGDDFTKVERVPSNLSMSMCSCCVGKDMTFDKTDFSQDDYEPKPKTKNKKPKTKKQKPTSGL